MSDQPNDPKQAFLSDIDESTPQNQRKSLARQQGEPELVDNDILKPQGSPWLWYGLLVFAIGVLVVTSWRSDNAQRRALQREQAQAAQAQQTQNAPAPRSRAARDVRR